MDEGGLQGTDPPLVPKMVGHRPSTRSCQLCHHRKIGCDRKKGSCTNCLRSNIPCYYPRTERVARRPHKTTITDVASRVTRLEHAVAAMSTGSLSYTPTIPTFEGLPIPSNSKSNASLNDLIAGGVVNSIPETHMERESSSKGLLVTGGRSSYFINEIMLSQALDEERELQSAMQSPQSCVTQDSFRIDSLDIGMPLSHFRKPSSDDQLQLPSSRQSIQLWRTYLERVDPVAKILHVPTMEAVLFRAVKYPASIDNDLKSLLFGIFFAAITSLDSSSVASIYGEQKITLLIRFKESLEQSLAACDFLAHPSMKSIQAMAIYLRCLRPYKLGRSSWTLFGLLMRSAQSIGVHRDGIDLRLPPFESEMRRRLWWFIYSIEARAAEDHGISVSDHAVNSARPQFPSNLHDSDLYPDMAEIPPLRPTWTAMTFLIVILETSFVMWRDIPSSNIGNSSAGSSKQVLESYRERLEDKYLQHCIPDVPAQRATILMGRLLLAKATFNNQLQRSKHASNIAPSASNATEESLIAATGILEISVQLNTEDTLIDFHWLFRTYIQYHPLLYVFWHLCIKPTGPNVERAWDAGLKAFEITGDHGSSTEGELKWSMVQNLKRKASERRQEPLNQQFVGSGADHGLPGSIAPIGYDDSWDPKIWDLDYCGIADWNGFVDATSTI